MTGRENFGYSGYFIIFVNDGESWIEVDAESLKEFCNIDVDSGDLEYTSQRWKAKTMYKIVDKILKMKRDLGEFEVSTSFFEGEKFAKIISTSNSK